MAILRIRDLSFTYPSRDTAALSSLSFSVNAGEFVTLMGSSGCGKTTLLRLLKPVLSPHGKRSGEIIFEGAPLSSMSERDAAARIGFVAQESEHQIVTDKVWHELAFGLESLGYSTPQIRTRVSEMASFFGIEDWFHKRVTELSGGQKQLLNLASVMVLEPTILLLDEPTAELSPIAAEEFLSMLYKINRELGVTVILSEHRLEDAIPLSDRVMVLDGGSPVAFAPPRDVAKTLYETNHKIFSALPTPIRVFTGRQETIPLSVREGRECLSRFSADHPLYGERIPCDSIPDTAREPFIELKDLSFRYRKDAPDILCNLSLSVPRGEFLVLLGGNGAGKTTLLSLLAGLYTPQRGTILLGGVSRARSKVRVGLLPQDASTLFLKKTVRLDLLDALWETRLSAEEKEARVRAVSQLCRLEELLDVHPFDLSGGERERAGLAKVLLLSPDILLLDEPTHGMDASFKNELGEILTALTHDGTTVVAVSHDVEFCARFATRCALVFDSHITSEGAVREFFAGKHFYTTAANRMARHHLPHAVLPEDILLAMGEDLPQKEHTDFPSLLRRNAGVSPSPDTSEPVLTTKKSALPRWRKVLGGILFFLFLLTAVGSKQNHFPLTLPLKITADGMGLLSAVFAVLGIVAFFARRERLIAHPEQASRKLTKRTLWSTLICLLLIPVTIFIGAYYLGDRKYYFVSLLIILEISLPFFLSLEGRRPKARELIILSVLSALAVAGRISFYMLPQFKPVVALIILSGVAFGGEAGFLVGAVSGFVSDMFFGQGPWTPWQMFAFGIIGFLAGVLFRKGLLGNSRTSLSLFGGFAALFIYGGIMNPAAVFLSQAIPTKGAILSAYLVGFPLDLIHAVATAFFLWFLAEPMLEKLERVKLKYGLLEP